MSKPNLFQIAAKELAQDSFFTWLIQWADSANEKYDKELNMTAKSFVKLLTNNTTDVVNVSAGRQWYNIDIWAEVNDDIFIAIEDKINTGEHSDQLERYKQIVQEHYQNKRDKLFLVYLKTGNESITTINEVIKKGYSVIDRKTVLEILNSCTSKNDILTEFRDNLNIIESQTNSFNTLENINTNWRAAEGFFLKLQEMLLPERSDWRYVANQTGGFLAFTCYWTDFDDYSLWIQIENAIDSEIKLVIKIGEWEPSVDKLHSFFEKLQNTAKQYGLNLIKPARYRTGETSTVAIVENAFQTNSDGTFDFENFHKTLNMLGEILDTHSPD